MTKNKLQDTYNTQLTKMRKPGIKIVNFNQQMEKEQIEIYRIPKFSEWRQYSITYKTQRVIYSKNGILRMFSSNSYTVYENLEVSKCFHCHRFYHKKQACRNSLFYVQWWTWVHAQIVKVTTVQYQMNKYKTKYSTAHHATDLTKRY